MLTGTLIQDIFCLVVPTASLEQVGVSSFLFRPSLQMGVLGFLHTLAGLLLLLGIVFEDAAYPYVDTFPHTTAFYANREFISMQCKHSIAPHCLCEHASLYFRASCDKPLNNARWKLLCKHKTIVLLHLTPIQHVGPVTLHESASL